MKDYFDKTVEAYNVGGDISQACKKFYDLLTCHPKVKIITDSEALVVPKSTEGTQESEPFPTTELVVNFSSKSRQLSWIGSCDKPTIINLVSRVLLTPHMKNLESLTINNGIAVAAPASVFPHLKKLSVNGYTNFNHLALSENTFPAVEEITITGEEILSIKGIEKFTALKILALDTTPSDFSTEYLVRLPNLEKIIIDKKYTERINFSGVKGAKFNKPLTVVDPSGTELFVVDYRKDKEKWAHLLSSFDLFTELPNCNQLSQVAEVDAPPVAILEVHSDQAVAQLNRRY